MDVSNLLLLVYYIGIRSNDNLHSKCVGGFNQNNNASFNKLVQKIRPKILNNSSTIVEIAVYITACVFNKLALLIVMNAFGINYGPNAHQYAEKIDSERLKVVDKRANENTRHKTMQTTAIDRSFYKLPYLEASTTAEKLLYK